MSYAHPPDGPDTGHGWFLVLSTILTIGLVLASCKPLIPPLGTVAKITVVTEAEARAYCEPATGVPGAIGCTKVDPEGCTSVVPRGRTDVLLHELNHCLQTKFRAENNLGAG